VLVSIAIRIAVDSLIILSGSAALRLFPDLLDPDMALIMLGTLLPAEARGIFFVGLLAVIMSTVNSFLQSGASSLAYDVVRHLRPAAGQGQLLVLFRLFVVALGVLSLGLALWFQSIVLALLFTLTMWTAGILIPTLATLTGRRLRKDTALYSLLAGMLSSLVWKIVQPFEVDALFTGLGASLLVVIALEILRPGPQTER
jgi:SSS family solute:Na+ symporter